MKKIYLILIAFLGLHLLVLSKLQFTAWPEMLSFPYMVDKGLLIYKDFHHVYQPLLTFILFIYYKFAGFSPESLKVFTWVSILATDLLIYKISNQLSKNKWISLIPVGLYVILQPLFEGNMLWFDMATVVPLLLSIYFVLRWSQDKKRLYIFLSGLFLTAAFLIKQQTVLVFFFIFYYLWAKKISFREFTVFAVGASIPIVIPLFLLILTGDLKDYLFWTFQLPLYWFPKSPGYRVWPITKEWFITLLMVTIPIPGIITRLRSKIGRPEIVLIYGIFLTSLIFAYPRFSFFHLQPSLAIFVVAFTFLFLSKRKIFLVLAFLAIFYIGFYRYRLILPEFGGGVRFHGKGEIQLAQYIEAITTPNDTIYLLGPHSAIYIYANRTPPKPWIENYVWHFEVPGLQEKVIEGWKVDSPKFIFWTPPTNGNWFDTGTYQPGEIVKYIENNYKKVDQLNGVGVWRLK